MKYSTFAALTNYSTAAAALAAHSSDGEAWLLNDTQIFQDGTMPKSGPASVKKNRSTQMASTLEKRWTEDSGGISTPSIHQGSARWTTYYATKTPAIGIMVSWYITDSTQSKGYKKVNGILEA